MCMFVDVSGDIPSIGETTPMSPLHTYLHVYTNPTYFPELSRVLPCYPGLWILDQNPEFSIGRYLTAVKEKITSYMYISIPSLMFDVPGCAIAQ